MRFEFGPWGVDVRRGRIREETFAESIRKTKDSTAARGDDFYLFIRYGFVEGDGPTPEAA